MTKTGWILAIGILIVLVGGGVVIYVLQQRAELAPQEEVSEATPGTTEESSQASGTEPATTVDATVAVGTPSPVTVTYTDQGFSPKNVSVAVGTSVHFVNNSTHGMWVGSDDHPSHTKYDGTSTKEHCVTGKNINGTFDACTAMAPGTEYDFVFTKAGTFAYHNHVASSDVGAVVVK